MDSSIKEEIDGKIYEALAPVNASYSIDFEPSNSDGEGSNSCFRMAFEYDSLYEDLFDDVERAIDNSGLCTEYDLYYFWRDRDFYLCTKGWDINNDD